jgi:hypothetical protein
VSERVSGQLPGGGLQLSTAEIDALEARWSSCWTPEEVAVRLAGVAARWCVAGGWALDLFRGEQTREHGDLEIAIPAADFPLIRVRFSEYAFDGVGSGRIWPDAPPEVLAATHQTWLRDPASGGYLVDVFREPHDGNLWICRRDESIRRPYAEIIHRTRDGIPYLAPELVLLFKAKRDSPKDRADFEGATPLIGQAKRAALGEMLSRVHPGHSWLTLL